MRSHLEASRLFLDAAEQLQGMSETVRLGHRGQQY
jgi:hypothetical protein